MKLATLTALCSLVLFVGCDEANKLKDKLLQEDKPAPEAVEPVKAEAPAPKPAPAPAPKKLNAFEEFDKVKTTLGDPTATN